MLRRLLDTTKQDATHFIRHGSWIVFGNVFNMALTFVLSIFYANFLSPEFYGNYKYILSIIGAVSIFTLSGLDTAIYISKTRNKAIDVSHLVSRKIAYGVIGGFISLAAGIYFAINGNLAFALPFFFTCWLVPFNDVFNVYTELWRSNMNFRKPALALVSVNTLNTILLIVLILAHAPLWLLVAAPMFIVTCASYIAYRHAKRAVTGTHTTFSAEENQRALSYGKHLSVIKAMSTLSGYVQNILIFKILGNNALAIFFFMTAPTEQIRGLGGALIESMFPKIAAADWQKQNFRTIVGRLMHGFLISWLIVAAYLAIVRPFFETFFPAYADYVHLSMILSLTLPFSFLAMTLQSVMRNHASVRTQYWFTIVDIALFLGLMIVSGIWFGLLGIAWGILAYKIIQTCLFLYVVTPKKMVAA